MGLTPELFDGRKRLRLVQYDSGRGFAAASAFANALRRLRPEDFYRGEGKGAAQVEGGVLPVQGLPPVTCPH